MTVGEKFVDALAGYTSGTDNKLFLQCYMMIFIGKVGRKLRLACK